MIDELDFNSYASNSFQGDLFCLLRDEQFHKAISAGAISILSDEIRQPILEVYTQIGKVNQAINRYTNQLNSLERPSFRGQIMDEMKKTHESIIVTKNKLTNFLANED